MTEVPHRRRTETDHPEVEESRRVTLAACALVACAQLAFGFIDLPLFGPVAAALDFLHSGVTAIAGLWLWSRRDLEERAYEIVFSVLALMFFPVIAVSEARGAELVLARDPLVPLQFVMIGIATLAPGRTRVGMTLLVLFALSTTGFWAWLRTRYPLPGALGEPWMTLVYAGVAATLFALRVRRRRLIRELATARAEAEALARMARLFLGVRDQTNTPLQTLEIAIALVAQRCPESDALVARMSHATTRLRDLTGLLSAAEAWPHEGADLDVDLEHEVAEAARALDRAFAPEPHA